MLDHGGFLGVHLSQMKKVWIIILVMMVGVPLLSSAKTRQPRGYEHSRGKEISVSEPLGWPVLVSGKSGREYLDAGIESLPGMTVLKVKGYTPWWQFWGSLPATTTISVAGFPTNTKLHVYTRGYRDHSEVTTNKTGRLMLDVPTKEGRQFIIKATPSTYHINIDTLFGPPGGDCSAIGTWDIPSKTCTLTTDVNRDGNRTIAIEDDGITLDGNGHKVIGIGSDDGVYTDMSNVTVKNLDVSGFARGIVYVASHGLIFAPPTGGTIQSVTLANLSQNLHIEGMSDLVVNSATSIGADTGVFITDLNLDGFPTYGITITSSTIKNAIIGAYIDNVDPITLTQNNWQDNGTDISQVSSGLILALLPQRGNFWSKFTACTQDPAPANPNHCTNRYNVPGTGISDTRPWACKDGWKAGMTCPRVTPPPTGSGLWGEVSTTAGTASLYSDQAMTAKIKTLPNEWALKMLDSSSDPVKVHDLTDNVDGYIKASDLKIASAGSVRETELKNNAEVVYDTKDKRVPVILDAVNLYYDNSNGNKSLYNPAGGLDGKDNFKELFDNANFPKEAVLAIIADETGSPAHALNNELCNDSLDGGLGIMQLTISYRTDSTFDDPKGLGGGMNIPSHKNDCRKVDGWTVATSSYYSNSKQGIYANIKDGFRVLQTKYEAPPVTKGILASTTDSWFTDGTTTINKKDMVAILTIRGNRGFGGTRCLRLANQEEYPGLIGDALLKLPTYFPTVAYEDSGHDYLAAKLKLAEKYKDKISTCSPVYLQILDQRGNVTGYNGSTVINNTAQVFYDDYSYHHADIFFNNEFFTYRVIGTEAGTYDLFIDSYQGGQERTVSAVSIPTTAGAIHEYNVNWPALLSGKKSVNVKVDGNGDDVFENSFTAGYNVTAIDFQSNRDKETICHRPPGNPGNTQTITVGASAVKAHLAHGDKNGKCNNEKEGKVREDDDDERNDRKHEDNDKNIKAEKFDKGDADKSELEKSLKTPWGQTKKAKK